MELLKNFLGQYVSLSETQFETLEASLREMELDAGDYLLREGNICRTICFVKEGTLRVLHFDQDGEVTRYFIPKDARLFPGLTVVEALALAHERWVDVRSTADAVLRTPPLVRSEWKVRRDTDALIERFGDQIPAWIRLVQKLHEDVLQQRTLGRTLGSRDVRERLQLFNEEYPGLSDEIPTTTLASFLRISPLELNRIRGEVTQ